MPHLSVYTITRHTLMQRTHIMTPYMIAPAQAVPQKGDFYCLPAPHEDKVLIHCGDHLELISNVCKHRGALIYEGRGSLYTAHGLTNPQGNIVCPLHFWSYAGIQLSPEIPTGTLLNAPLFTHKPCFHLEQFPIFSWHGLIFLFQDQTAKDTFVWPTLSEQAELIPGNFLFHSELTQPLQNHTVLNAQNSTLQPSNRLSSATFNILASLNIALFRENDAIILTRRLTNAHQTSFFLYPEHIYHFEAAFISEHQSHWCTKEHK